MATLTPLSKGLIALAVVGAVASAVWHIGLKDWMADGNSGVSNPGAPASQAGVASGKTTIQTSAPSASSANSANPSPPAAKQVEKAAESTSSANKSAAASPIAHLSSAESSEMGRKLLDTGDHAQARIYLEQAVKGGDGAAACLLGEMTLKGQGGIPANQEKAASLFQLAQAKNIICFASSK